MLLAVDPGTHAGWAIFYGGMLIACGLGDRPEPAPPQGFDDVIVEHPVIYPNGKTRNPNDIVKLAVKAGEWRRYRKGGAEVIYVEPRAWKGTVDPETINKRALERLRDDERQVFEDAVRTARIPKSKQHNVLDAIGIGLSVTGRWR